MSSFSGTGGGGGLSGTLADDYVPYWDDTAGELVDSLWKMVNSGSELDYQGSVGYLRRIGSRRLGVGAGGVRLMNSGGSTIDMLTYYGKTGVGGAQINEWAPEAMFAIWDSAGPQLELRHDSDSRVYAECDDSENVTWTAETSAGKVLHKNLAIEDLALPSPTVPGSATAIGTPGQIAWDSSYFYVCTATDTWVRTALATW